MEMESGQSSGMNEDNLFVRRVKRLMRKEFKNVRGKERKREERCDCLVD